MGPVVEVRTSRAKPSMRAPLLDLLRSRAFALHRELGMRVLGPFPSQEDDVTFVWLAGPHILTTSTLRRQSHGQLRVDPDPRP